MGSSRVEEAAGGKFLLTDNTEGFPRSNSIENTNTNTNTNPNTIKNTITKAHKVVDSHYSKEPRG